MYKALIVEDEQLMREYLCANLNAINTAWQVTGSAQDGRAALELLKQHDYDLVITDIRMPEMDGLELAHTIREHYPQIPVVIVSGHDEFSYAREAVRCNVSDYLLKPLCDDEVSAALDRMAVKIESLRAAAAPAQLTSESLLTRFLDVLIRGDHEEVKALYPAVCRAQKQVRQGLKTLLLLAPDDAGLLLAGYSGDELRSCRLSLNQIAIESSFSPVLFDPRDNIVLLVTAENAPLLLDRCIKLFHTINEAFTAKHHASLIGSYGEAVKEFLELEAVYPATEYALMLSALGCASPVSSQIFISQKQHIAQLNELIAALEQSMLNNDSSSMYANTAKFAHLLPNGFGSADVLARGCLLLRLTRFVKKSAVSPAQAYSFMLERIQAWPLCMEQIIDVYFSILTLLCNADTLNASKASEHNKLTDRAREYICMHFSEPLSLCTVADALGVTSGYLSAVFHTGEGESYSKFLTRIRMEQAALLLRTCPHEKIFSIAAQVGFISPRHFISVFKKHYAMTPSEYQEKHLS